MTTTETSTTEEFYVFQGRDGWAWCEAFTASGHFVAPTPFRSVSRAVEEVERRNPAALVDWLPDDCVPAELRRWEADGGRFDPIF